ncbi:MAG: peptidylprolyl isomerase, partial [Flavobacteriaceae bacterium]|nr:peptidylprolyl isomerase [Flavobacteriaceae bacterium]
MKTIYSILFYTFLLNLGHGQQSSLDVNQSKIKIDGVSAVVGDYIILESDVDKTLIDLQSQGVSVQNITRCSLLGKLMED